MGPRLWSRGKQNVAGDFIAQERASMGPRLWSRGKPPELGPVPTVQRRFNGAAALQPRKVESGRRIWPTPPELQWGRGFGAAESGHKDLLDLLTTPRFNGAAALQPRKGAMRLEAKLEAAASMGPRLWSRGKLRSERVSGVPLAASMGPRLWSRGKTVSKAVD